MSTPFFSQYCISQILPILLVPFSSEKERPSLGCQFILAHQLTAVQGIASPTEATYGGAVRGIQP